MSRNQGSGLPKPSSPNQEAGQQGFEGLLWGPIMDGPGPFADEGSKGLSQKKSWPELKNVIAQLAQRSSRGPCHPRLAQEQGQRGKWTSSKGNLKYLRKASFATFPMHISAPSRALSFDFINNSQRLRSGTDGTSISLGNVDHTRGRRKLNAC